MKVEHVILIGIVLLSFGIKFYETDFSEPIFSDAIEYNQFAWNLSHGVKDLPVLHNIGFSLFLAPIFYFVHDFGTSSIIQKASSIIFSTVTIPVFYMLSRRFLPYKYSLIATGFIAFEPHIIQNVTFGITEPLYIFLFVVSLLFSTSKNTKIIILSFFIAGLATITRFEGVSLLALISLAFLYKNYKTRKKLLYLIPALGMFLIPVSMTVLFNLDFGTHENVITSKIQHEVNVASDLTTHNESFMHKIANSVTYLGWATYPFFIWFIPIGLYYLFKRKQIIIPVAILALLAFPGLFAYIRAYDTRYFMQLYPILAIISAYAIMSLSQTKIARIIPMITNAATLTKISGTAISLGVISLLIISMTHANTSNVYASSSGMVVIYPTYTLSAYDKAGFYTYYKGLCDARCLVIPDRFNNLDRISTHDYGIDTIRHLGFKIVSDSDVDSNPKMLDNYSTVILLHNEYVTQKEFDAITHHKNVIYLYPNALYALVERGQDNSLTLIRGHNYPAEDIRNGFNWKYDNSELEYNRACNDMHFYSIPNGHMLNCYPEDIINSDQHLWDMISHLKI